MKPRKSKSKKTGPPDLIPISSFTIVSNDGAICLNSSPNFTNALAGNFSTTT